MLDNINNGRIKKECKRSIQINKQDVIEAFEGFDINDINLIMDICAKNMILPQEIVNNNVLRNYE